VQCNPEIELVIAGPGGGKTHNMVGKILNSIEVLSPTRYCAVITYTNAATENIKSRIENKISIPQNIFIGTTHSFLIKFIFEPFAHLFDIVPIDKNYIEAVKLSQWEEKYYEDEILKIKADPNLDFKKKAGLIKGIPSRKANKNFSKAEDFLNKGLITYDKILEKSFDLLKNETVLKTVSNRLQFIYIDEYQDSRVYQHLIIQKIIEQGNTKLYCIGDPLQSIFRFAYTQSQLKNEPSPLKFIETPLLELFEKQKDNTIFIKNNYRCSRTIVSLINQFIIRFNADFQQEAKGVNAEVDHPVCFIQESEIKKIIEQYNSIKQHFQITDEAPEINKNLYLSDEWSLFENVANEANLNRLVKDNSKYSSYLGEVMQLATGMIGMKKKEIISITSTELTYRKFCLNIFRIIKQRTFKDDDHFENTIRKMFQDEFKVELMKDTRGKIQIAKTTSDLKTVNSNTITDYYSTIHSAKGLEATSVLVCAKTQNQLIKWLSFDKIIDEDDDFRLGYVAFSRARKFLSIACLQPIDNATKNTIRSLGIELSSEINHTGTNSQITPEIINLKKEIN
jgi:DNA helicase II / ATP-dependent DNA helicase PcrA